MTAHVPSWAGVAVSVLLVGACLVVVVNLLVDLSYSLLDPRIELA